MKRNLLQLWKKEGVTAVLCAGALLAMATSVSAAETGVNDTIANALKGDWGQIKLMFAIAGSMLIRMEKRPRMEILSGCDLVI